MLEAELEHAVGEARLDVRLAVESGRCLALAGPSGVGKTTILRLLAGTARPVRGRVVNGPSVWVDTVRGTYLAPELRRCGYVFQDYALFPHLSAWRNVAYGLRGVDRRRRRATAITLLERFQLSEMGEKRPSELSGGERQRVALARALAARPTALLLDEPLAALDTRTRAEASRTLLSTLRSLDVPTVLVTHDFEQAALLGDEVAVIDGGRLIQRGSPAELAARPASAFVADFTGAVVLTGTVAGNNSGLTIVELDGGGRVSTTEAGSGRVAVSIHPWEITLRYPDAVKPPESAQNHVRARVESLADLANRVRVALTAGQPLVADVSAQAAATLALEVGCEVVASWKATATRLTAL